MATTNRHKNKGSFGEGINQPNKATQFGQPNGNKAGAPKLAVDQREFYRWCEAKASLDELQAYADDASKPAARRAFVKALLRCNKVEQFFELTNQTHGQPKQVIEQIETPVVNIVLE